MVEILLLLADSTGEADACDTGGDLPGVESRDVLPDLVSVLLGCLQDAT